MGPEGGLLGPHPVELHRPAGAVHAGAVHVPVEAHQGHILGTRRAAAAGQGEAGDLVRGRELEARQVSDLGPEEPPAHLEPARARGQDQEPPLRRVPPPMRRVGQAARQLALPPLARDLVELGAPLGDEDQVLGVAAVLRPHEARPEEGVVTTLAVNTPLTAGPGRQVGDNKGRVAYLEREELHVEAVFCQHRGPARGYRHSRRPALR